MLVAQLVVSTMQQESTTPAVASRDESETRLGVRRSRQRAGLLSILCASGCFLTVVCWLALLRWFALVEHYAMPGFAFDKIPGHMQSPVLRGTVLIFCTLGLLYIGIFLLCRAMPRISLLVKVALVVTVAVSGVINVLLYPVAAIDVFYYLCQLKLAFYYHQNPYVVTFVPFFAADPFVPYAWPLEVPLTYGPAWLLLSGMPAVLAGFENLLQLLLSYKLFSFALLALSGWVIAQYQDDEKDRWLGVYTLLANPLVLFEAVANAHNDVMMTFFLLLAVLALKRQSALALPLLTLAALIKALSVVLFPLFLLVMVTHKWQLRSLLVSILLTVVLASVAIAPFWNEGRMVDGLLSGMTFTGTLATAAIASFVRENAQQTQASAAQLVTFRFLLGGLCVVLSFLIAWRLKDVERVCAYILLVFYTLVVALQPWYLIPVIALLSIQPRRVEFAFIASASTIGLLINILDVWARFSSGLSFTERHLLGTVCMNVPLLLVLVVELWRSPRRREQPAFRWHGSDRAG